MKIIYVRAKAKVQRSQLLKLAQPYTQKLN